jgi:hypothetical protein
MYLLASKRGRTQKSGSIRNSIRDLASAIPRELLAFRAELHSKSALTCLTRVGLRGDDLCPRHYWHRAACNSCSRRIDRLCHRRGEEVAGSSFPQARQSSRVLRSARRLCSSWHRLKLYAS